jgi:hypothetical protein
MLLDEELGRVQFNPRLFVSAGFLKFIPDFKVRKDGKWRKTKARTRIEKRKGKRDIPLFPSLSRSRFLSLSFLSEKKKRGRKTGYCSDD